MALPKFTYLAAQSLDEACALLTEHGDKARLMAGGTDVLIQLGRRGVAPPYIIGLRNIAGLDYVRFAPDQGLAIGALTSPASIAEHEIVQSHYPALAQAAGAMATVQIRNMATVAGNICNASPCADTAGPLLVYGASVVVRGPGGKERVLALEDFFCGPGQTALEKAEVLREIRVPAPTHRSGSAYQRLSARSKADIAAASVSAALSLDAAGCSAGVRIALGAVAPVPMRAREAERALEGKHPDSDLIAEAASLAAKAAKPISDVRASAAYRRHIVRVLSNRVLTQCALLASKALRDGLLPPQGKAR